MTKKHKKRVVAFAIVCIVFVGGYFLVFGNDKFAQEKREKKIDFFREWQKSSKVPIEFYGKVIDQNNLPVTKALIKISTGVV